MNLRSLLVWSNRRDTVMEHVHVQPYIFEPESEDESHTQETTRSAYNDISLENSVMSSGPSFTWAPDRRHTPGNSFVDGVSRAYVTLVLYITFCFYSFVSTLSLDLPTFWLLHPYLKFPGRNLCSNIFSPLHIKWSRKDTYSMMSLTVV